MERYSLKDKVLQYQKTGEGLREIIIILSQRIYNFPKSRFGWKEDDCGEFFIYFYPRLIKAVKNFKDQGKPFEWYLNSLLRWQYKNFSQNKRKSEKSWVISADLDFWELPVEGYRSENRETGRLDPQIAEVLGFDHTGKIKKTCDRKAFLFWILKYVRFIDEQAIDRISEFTGYKREWLTDIIDELKIRLHPREQRLRKLKTRQNKAFYNTKLIEEEIRVEMDQEKRKLLNSRLQKLKRTIRLAQDKIARIPLSPTNRDIGEVLDIPKGSVDTSLYWLKKRVSMLYPENPDENKQYA